MPDFAALEARANSFVFSTLTNATATIGSAAEPVRGIFDSPFDVGLADGPGFAGALPQISVPTESVPALWEGVTVSITAGQGVGSYSIRAHRPDGSGLSILDLDKA